MSLAEAPRGPASEEIHASPTLMQIERSGKPSAVAGTHFHEIAWLEFANYDAPAIAVKTTPLVSMR